MGILNCILWFLDLGHSCCPVPVSKPRSDILSGCRTKMKSYLPFQSSISLPFLRNGLHLSIFFHTGELEGFLLHSKNSLFCRYLALKDWAQLLVSLVSTFYASLHWNALLMACILRSPKLLLTFGMDTWSQAISDNPFSILVFFPEEILI